MSQPPVYNPVHAFISDSATLANFPGPQLDVEFNDVKATTDAILANLQLIQRDDGALKNGSVTFDTLSVSLQSAGLQAAVAWTTGTTYALGTNVFQSGSLYRALVAHTAGVFATDLAALKWVLVGALTAGPQGPQGNIGNTGNTGAQGVAGPTGLGYAATSATSLLIANNVPKLFLLDQATTAYQIGSYVRASSAASGANFMEGSVTAYAGTALTIAVTLIGGSGTHTDWTFASAGVPGSSGVSSLAGNTGAWTLGNGLKNVVNELDIDPSFFPVPFGGRGTVLSGVPVPNVDVIGSQNIYYAPFTGKVVPTYTSGVWTLRQFTTSATDQVTN